ncbi:MAG: hypothetical protein ACRYG5_04275, partial [Janthinobacterium lividum]
MALFSGAHRAIYLSSAADEARLVEHLDAHIRELRRRSLIDRHLATVSPDMSSSEAAAGKAQLTGSQGAAAGDHARLFEQLSALAKFTGLSLQSFEAREGREALTKLVRLRAEGSFNRVLRFLRGLRQSTSATPVSAEAVGNGGLLALKLDLERAPPKRPVSQGGLSR